MSAEPECIKNLIVTLALKINFSAKTIGIVKIMDQKLEEPKIEQVGQEIEQIGQEIEKNVEHTVNHSSDSQATPKVDLDELNENDKNTILKLQEENAFLKEICETFYKNEEEKKLDEIIMNDRIDYIKKIISLFGESFSKDEFFRKRLLFALINKKYNIAKYFIDNGVDINGLIGDKPLIFNLITPEYLEQLEFFLDQKPDLTVSPKNSMSKNNPIHQAAAYANTDLIKLFIKKGADINATTEYNETALHVAIRNSNNETAKILIEHGARFDIIRKHPAFSPDRNALEYAAINELNDVIEMLLERKATYNEKNVPSVTGALQNLKTIEKRINEKNCQVAVKSTSEDIAQLSENKPVMTADEKKIMKITVPVNGKDCVCEGNVNTIMEFINMLEKMKKTE